MLNSRATCNSTHSDTEIVTVVEVYSTNVLFLVSTGMSLGIC